ncbi:MAG: ABC transporter ATP-binding protein, partial [Opitutaceae bacterium]
VIGPNGAGKSTFFDLLTGRTKPDSGTIEYFRKVTAAGALPSATEERIDLTALNEYRINRLGIGRKFQTPSVYLEHTVFENLMLSLKGGRGVFAALFHRTSPAERRRIDELLELVRLPGKRDRPAGELAHGEKQWLEIGMLLAQDPEILLVDEPAAGMTDEETRRTGELLISLAGRRSLIVVEHDMAFVRQIARAGEVTVLHQGSVLCEGSFEQVQANPRVREVYLGRGKAAA